MPRMKRRFLVTAPLLAAATLGSACVVSVDSQGQIIREEKRFKVSGIPELHLTTFEDTPVAGTIPASDPDGNELAIELIGPQHGTVSLNGLDVTYVPAADFNGTVMEPAYVNEILDRLSANEREIFDLLLYVEQPFPDELEDHPLDVRSVAARKPLFMDESAHNWQQIRLGRALGWTGVALKTCKTQTEALLSLCWAKAHGMQVMVQDLTNPMLAQIPHVLLAAHAGTIMGVETNAMQFYPQASVDEARVHPGLYTRRDGQVDLSTVRGAGFGYAGAESARALPGPVISYGIGRPLVVPRWHAG